MYVVLADCDNLRLQHNEQGQHPLQLNGPATRVILAGRENTTHPICKVLRVRLLQAASWFLLNQEQASQFRITSTVNKSTFLQVDPNL